MKVVGDVAKLATSVAKTAAGDVDIEGLIEGSMDIAKDFVLPVCDPS
jgi:hypothetical protein